MKQYQKKNFNIPNIKGISEKALEIHLGLYEGYVKNLNTHYSALKNSCGANESATLIAPALTRRISFELAGVLNHEKYFEAIEGGAVQLTSGTSLETSIDENFGNIDTFKICIQKTAMLMRGIGWVLVVYDKNEKAFHIIWVSDHELGNVNLPIVIALDMWEHAYMVDYAPSEKKEYVDAYLNAINWNVIEKNFDSIIK